VLAQVWRELCWRALPRMGWRAVAHYWRARRPAEPWQGAAAGPNARPPAI
jgi:hypothetical protein